MSDLSSTSSVRRAGKAPGAFRTISEVADVLDVPQHVLRFWESKFTQVKPMKRGGGRRYYRPEDVDILRGIRHLLYTDGRQTFLTRLDERSAETRALEPGIHVVCNRDPADPSSSKVRNIRKAVAQIDLDAPFTRVFDGLAGILAQHGAGDPLEHTCVHTPEYGTRSSAILALGEERWRYWHAEGPPCQAKFRNFTRLLDDLRRRSVREERT